MIETTDKYFVEDNVAECFAGGRRPAAGWDDLAKQATKYAGIMDRERKGFGFSRLSR